VGERDEKEEGVSGLEGDGKMFGDEFLFLRQ
jgi:hypothetical protein